MFKAVSLLMLFHVGTLFAQPGGRTPEMVWQDQSAAAALDREKEALAERLIAAKESPGREFPAAFRRALIEGLKKESMEDLEARIGSGNIRTMALGDRNADLTYTTFAEPCRIIDTRLGGGGRLLDGADRDFRVIGTGLDVQGGAAGGCGIPLGASVALINFVAVSPLAAGNLRASAYPNPVPAAGSIINYQALTPNLNIANGLLFPLCDPTTASDCNSDIRLQANGGSVHLVADVLGYARRFPKEAVRTFISRNSTNLPSGPIPLTCLNYLTVGIDVPGPGFVWVRGNVKFRIDHAAGSQNFYAIVAASPTNCSISAEQGLHVNWLYTQNYPVGSSYRDLTVDGTFYVPSAGAAAFYLNGKTDTGSTDIGVFHLAGLIAVFLPD